MPEIQDTVSALDQAHLDAFVVAQSYLLPDSAAPTTAASLTLAMPQQLVVVRTGPTQATYLTVAAQNLTMTASSDNYVIVSSTGAYTVQAVTVGAGQPTTPANSLILYKATTSGTAITAVTQVATGAPVAGAMVQTATPNGVAALDGATRLPVGQLPTNIAVGGKFTLPTQNYSNAAGGGGNVNVGAALSGNVPVNNGIANGTTWQINTTAATGGSTPVVTPACGAVSNMGFVVQTNPGGGSFIVMLNTTNGAALNAAGAFYWAIVSSL